MMVASARRDDDVVKMLDAMVTITRKWQWQKGGEREGEMAGRDCGE